MFNAKALCRNLKVTKPPYKCPAENCGKTFKSFSGAKVHLYKSHNRITKLPKERRKDSFDDVKNSVLTNSNEAVQYAEADNTIEVVIDAQQHSLKICDPLDLIDAEEFQGDGCISEDYLLQPSEKAKTIVKNNRPYNKHSKNRKISSIVTLKTPEPSFRVIENYDPPNVLVRPSSYYKYDHTIWEELSKEVEYDMDDEDVAWLSIINERRKMNGLSEINENVFELLMDRLEKESYSQCQSIAEETLASIDENAVCCICNDGDCDDSNAILFCDMCNLPVHQECYGVPYIPEGQWLCRRCTHSPSFPVDCVLCPNKDGAFKQTDDNRWAHVICALWIPEVGFSNPNFLEPIDSIQNIPRARWKLCCYICKKKNIGACIQCKKTSCYTAFHVTCAQNEGLFMEMKAVKANGIGDAAYEIKKSAFCYLHTPQPPYFKDTGSDDGDSSSDRQTDGSKGMQTLTELSVPVTSIPNISPKILIRTMKSLNIPVQQNFVERVLAFWKLKRQSRSGAPLLRRLQVTFYPKQKQIEIQKLETSLKLQPFILLLLRTMEQMQEKDVNNIFAEPVDVNVVTDYLEFIKNPMDFSTMRKKVQTYQYSSFSEFEDDFNLMLDNCLLYNAKDTVYYRTALEMRSQCSRILHKAREVVIKNKLDTQTGLFSEDITRQRSKHANDIERKLSRNHLHIAQPEQNGNKHSENLKGAYHFIPMMKNTREISFPDESDEENGIHSSSIKFSRTRTVVQHLKRMKKHHIQLQHCKKKSCVFKNSDRKLRSSVSHLPVNIKTKVPENLLSPSTCSPPRFNSWPSVRKNSPYAIEDTSPSPKNVSVTAKDVPESRENRTCTLRNRHLKKSST